MSNRKFNTKRIKKGMLAGVLALSVVISSTGSIVVNKTNTEAKRKKKNTKPKLILKGALKNKSVEIEEGETIKVNAIAKDKEDGNITKKVKIKVRNPENGEYEKRGKTIKFINDGTYKITVSVKDSKKVKASATRTIIVKENTENYSLATDRPVITNAPRPTSVVSAKPMLTNTPTVTKNPTEIPKETSQPSISETPEASAVPSSMPEESVMPIITENPAESPKETSQPSISETPEVSAVPSSMPEETKNPTTSETPIILAPDDYSNYDINEIEINNIKYKITNDSNFKSKYITPNLTDENNCLNDNIHLNIENDFSELYFSFSEIDDIVDNYTYLGLIGEITAFDNKGNDISNSIVIIASTWKIDKYVYVYAKDSEGNEIIQNFKIRFIEDLDSFAQTLPNVDYICNDPKAFCVKRNNIKKLTLEI